MVSLLGVVLACCIAFSWDGIFTYAIFLEMSDIRGLSDSVVMDSELQIHEVTMLKELNTTQLRYIYTNAAV